MIWCFAHWSAVKTSAVFANESVRRAVTPYQQQDRTDQAPTYNVCAETRVGKVCLCRGGKASAVTRCSARLRPEQSSRKCRHWAAAAGLCREIAAWCADGFSAPERRRIRAASVLAETRCTSRYRQAYLQE